MGKTRARELAHNASSSIWQKYRLAWPLNDREFFDEVIENVINTACREALDEASVCGNGIIVRSAEATNLVTTIHNKIIELKKRYADVKDGK